jgi:DNA mismatch endonuclease (patch repair protein)
MRANKKRNSSPELKVRSAAHRLGLRFFVLRSPEPQIRVCADLVFPTSKVAVFVDGCFWHGCSLHGTEPKTNAGYWKNKIQGNISRDRRVDEELKQAGWLSVRIWEHEDPNAAASNLFQLVRARRTALAIRT